MDSTKLSPNSPFLLHLDEIIKNVQYGPLNLSIQVHDGRAVSLYGKAFIHKKYKDDGGAKAMEEFLMAYREARDANKSGSLTVTFDMKNGKVQEMVVHSEYTHALKE